jgi:plasmid stabilization system protein ParE
MPQVRLSARAQVDVTRLHQFLTSKDDDAAKRAVLAIRDAFQALTHAPMIGRPVEDHPELRELVIEFGASGYLALYRPEPALNTVTILAIKHQREDDYK